FAAHPERARAAGGSGPPPLGDRADDLAGAGGPRPGSPAAGGSDPGLRRDHDRSRPRPHGHRRDPPRGASPLLPRGGPGGGDPRRGHRDPTPPPASRGGHAGTAAAAAPGG